MPSFSARNQNARYLVLVAALLVAGLALFLVTRHQADRTREVLAEDLTGKAKKVLVLLDEARMVCLETAASIVQHRRELARRRTTEGRPLPRSRWAHSSPHGAREELAFANQLIKRATAIQASAKRTYVRMGPGLYGSPVTTALWDLASMTRRVCHSASRSSGELSLYEAEITASLRSYQVQLARIEAPYLVSEIERVALLQVLERDIEESRRDAAATMRALDENPESWIPDPDAMPLEAKQPEQIRQERRELQAEEEWRQRQAEQREALHREAIGSWRDETQPTQRALPTLGLQEVDKDSITGLATQARAWSAVYRQETGPVTVALRRFDMIRRIEGHERTTRACRSLFTKVTDLLQSRRLFTSPSEVLNQLLESGYTSAQAAAEACLAGDMVAANSHFEEAERVFARIESEFGLSPG